MNKQEIARLSVRTQFPDHGAAYIAYSGQRLTVNASKSDLHSDVSRKIICNFCCNAWLNTISAHKRKRLKG